MEQKEYFGNGRIIHVEHVLQDIEARNIFLVTGKKSYESSEAKSKLDYLLRRYDVTNFSDFNGNPNLRDIEKGINLFNQGKYDMVMAVGGGRVIDTAKAINSLSVQSKNPEEYIRGKRKIKYKGKPLVAIPTTAGSGSEATHFAVIYVAGTKYSLADQSMLPDFAIIDPELTHSLPRKITAESGMDALSQAIEAYWSVNSTEESQRYSANTIYLVMDNLIDAVNNPSPKSREGMALASNLAGKAINEAKTTAPHAISYPMTFHFKVAHGQAVGLTLPSILLYNFKVTNEDCIDSRGVEYVSKKIEEICDFLGASGEARLAKFKLTELMQKIGLKTRLRDVGISTEEDVEKIVAEGFNLQRMKNNPRLITSDVLWHMLMQIR